MSIASTQQPLAPPENLTSSLQIIPISQIVPSKTNHRKTFSGPDFDELVESVRTHGVLQPVLVRPHQLTDQDVADWDAQWHTIAQGDMQPSTPGYELVAGERRYRAALAAGLIALPCTVRELSDVEAQELQLVENLQRKDVTALEEAEGFAQLLEQMAQAQPEARRQDLVQTLAEKIGKSVRYVWARLKLNVLIPEIKDAIEKGVLTASHGDLLAPFSEKIQRKIYEREFCKFNGAYQYIDDEDDFEDGDGGEDPEGLDAADRAQVRDSQQSQLQLRPPEDQPSVRNLKRTLVYQGEDLKKAAWKWNKEKEPVAGFPICATCESNTVNAGGEAKMPRCTNSDCFAHKQKAVIDVKLDALKQVSAKEPVMVSKSDYSAPKGVVKASGWKKAKPGECDNVVPGLQVGSENEWEDAFSVCATRKCKVHFGTNAVREDKAEQDREQKKKQLEADCKRENAVREKLAHAALAAITAQNARSIALRFILDRLDSWTLKRVAPLGLNGTAIVKKADLDSPDFAKLLGAVLLSQMLQTETYWGVDHQRKELNEALSQFGLDPNKLRAKFEAELDALAKKSPTPEQLASMPVVKKSAAKTASKKSSPKAGVAAKKAASPKKSTAKKSAKSTKKGGR